MILSAKVHLSLGIVNNLLKVDIVNLISTKCFLLTFQCAYYTAENTSSMLMDGEIHLTGGSLLAGYIHVIAFRWETNDDLSVAVAGKFH